MKRPRQIGVDDGRPFVRTHAKQEPAGGLPRVADHHIQPPPPGPEGSNHGVHLPGVPDVGAKSEPLAAAILDPGGGSVGVLLAFPVVDADPPTGLRKLQTDGAADPARAAGDEDRGMGDWRG